MKILWITNIIFPDPSKLLAIPPPISGGWMFGMVKQVSALPDIHLAVATTYTGSKLQTFKIDNVVYYLLPAKSLITYHKALEPIWRKVCDEFTPDIIHIHGTEFPHGLACMRSRPNLKYLVSIQGMVSVISRYYYADISTLEILKNITFRDLVHLDTIFQGRRSFQKRGEFEKEYLLLTNSISGRTSWDYAHIQAINPNATYYSCNRTLRNCFYTAIKWEIDKKNDYTIFLSDASYPIKGLHQVLKAVALLREKYPEIKIRISGLDITKQTTILDRIKLSGYGSYIRKLIKKLNLISHVKFIGSCTEERMIEEYQKAHLFICPSSIENSPNSVGEAQILGVPTIGSYVGGTPDMIEHNKSGLLYRFEEVEMLAQNIHKIFSDNKLALTLSVNGITEAEIRHDRSTNLNNTLEIYRDLLI